MMVKMQTNPDTASLLRTGYPSSVRELMDIILSLGNTNIISFDTLIGSVDHNQGSLQKILPFIYAEAVRANEELPPTMPVLQKPGHLTLTQRQCLCILANGFFCSFSNRKSTNCLSDQNVPSINFDELYNRYGLISVKVAKLQMLFSYFERCLHRLRNSDDLNRPIHFIRRQAAESTKTDWIRCNLPLKHPVMHPLEESIDDAKNMLRMDFANRIIGGAAIAYGYAQEEILFCLNPELIAARLFCPAMEDDVAVIIIGAEQFTKAKDYASSLQYGGTFNDPTPTRSDGALASYICAVDALDFRDGSQERQFSPSFVLRELTKAWAGFDIDEGPDGVATGNWGCGAFQGNAGLKSIIQWLAASRAQKTMHYFPWDNLDIYSRLPGLTANLLAKDLTVGELSMFLLDYLNHGDVYK